MDRRQLRIFKYSLIAGFLAFAAYFIVKINFCPVPTASAIMAFVACFLSFRAGAIWNDGV